MSIKSGFAGIVGRANVGKSTLLNSLIGQKISIVSDKAQTTRNRIQGVLNRPEGQIVFVDTPGMHKPKNRLDEYMVEVIKDTLSEMDLVLMMIDGSTGIGPGDEYMARTLPEKVPKILLINKMDLMDQSQFKRVEEQAKKLGDFKEILGLSATHPETTEGLIQKMFDYLKEGPLYYPEDQWTNMSERMLVSEIIREKALMFLDQEVPHGIAVVVDTFKEEDNRITIEATIIVEKDSHKGIVIGKGGRKLKGIGQAARMELNSMMEKPIHLELWVKVKPNWRESQHYVQDYGYKK